MVALQDTNDDQPLLVLPFALPDAELRNVRSLCNANVLVRARTSSGRFTFCRAIYFAFLHSRCITVHGFWTGGCRADEFGNALACLRYTLRAGSHCMIG